MRRFAGLQSADNAQCPLLLGVKRLPDKIASMRMSFVIGGEITCGKGYNGDFDHDFFAANEKKSEINPDFQR